MNRGKFNRTRANFFSPQTVTGNKCNWRC